MTLIRRNVRCILAAGAVGAGVLASASPAGAALPLPHVSIGPLSTPAELDLPIGDEDLEKDSPVQPVIETLGRSQVRIDPPPLAPAPLPLPAPPAAINELAPAKATAPPAAPARPAASRVDSSRPSTHTPRQRASSRVAQPAPRLPAATATPVPAPPAIGGAIEPPARPALWSLFAGAATGIAGLLALCLFALGARVIVAGAVRDAARSRGRRVLSRT